MEGNEAAGDAGGYDNYGYDAAFSAESSEMSWNDPSIETSETNMSWEDLADVPTGMDEAVTAPEPVPVSKEVVPLEEFDPLSDPAFAAAGLMKEVVSLDEFDPLSDPAFAEDSHAIQGAPSGAAYRSGEAWLTDAHNDYGADGAYPHAGR